jgi:hypothetical protein
VSCILGDGDPLRVAIEGGVVKYKENRAATLKILVGSRNASMRYAIITYPRFG